MYRPTCSSNERISRQDGLCYTIGNNSNICGHLMRFYSEHETSLFGDCDCDFTDGFTARPIVYWKPTDRCYHLYQRGPCGYNEWLILDHRNRTRCSPRRCASQEDSEKTDEFWFLYQGKCYKTGQHYNHFCPYEDQEQWKVWFNYTVSPLCLQHRPTPFLRGLLGPLKDLPCVPGHKKMQNGDCKRIARFSRNDFNDY
ncbi:unnamed protein product [Orchesella dallaii]|uniref:DUF4789 domain-containing protein n=1 Tax=Orchesella dallaii TaxID=48710 RepID=A0ABP1QXL2_9HEXA